ncbi:endonuclease/exonuclease/phosphatase [Sphingobium sp. IP1]|uniref:endonuclease/exonuclease/phosphatase family protein n=1 Tax=Sphingobium sp. IP1 TaxID=2021637 RepID=UPI000C085E86|nr:endonuclease/exonuclease/phosphatase family protein [Sphingobium sp. IP1]PHP20737.1 endonuclease/exonuclease/phosphatase [Sphingobium sp. IP1]
MRIMTYNTLFGGYDGADDRRARIQAEIVRDSDPDILLIQELKGFLDQGARRLYELERMLGLRALLAPSPHTGQNVGIMVREGIEILSFEADSAHFHHAAAIATLGVPGLPSPLTAVSVHLCPNGTPVRLREVSYLYGHAAPQGFAIVGGDFNSLAPGDPEPDDLDSLAPHFRARYVDANGRMDRRLIASLLQAGFVDLGAQLGDRRRTVPGSAFPDTEFPTFRSDYLLASDALAQRTSGFTTADAGNAGAASDHYAIYADFDFGTASSRP